MDRIMRKSAASPITSAAGGALLAAGFAVLAAFMLIRQNAEPIPYTIPQQVDRASLIPGPRRGAMTDPASIRIGTSQQSCNGCHQIFAQTTPADEPRDYHAQIRLNHGLNNRCGNCHDQQDAQKLVLHDRSTIGFSQAPFMCAQCHGTVYRDWQRGTHGKTLGSWIQGSSLQRRLGCNECHDPHSPRYTPMQPLPGPDTLRMGDQHEHSHPAGGRTSPLQRWLKTLPAAPDSVHPTDQPGASPVPQGALQ